MIVPQDRSQSSKQQLWTFVIQPCIVAVAALVGTWLAFSKFSFRVPGDQLETFCKPDGTVVVPMQLWLRDYYPWQFRTGKYFLAWDPGLLLNIVFGFGELTLPAAKGIDFCWDLLVGRGGQLFLAYFVHRVARKSLLLTMESEKLALPVVTTSLTDKTGPLTIWWMLVCIWKGRVAVRRPSKRRLGAIAFACCYVLVFASLVSIMTGYQAILKPYFREPGTQTLIPTDELYIPDFVVVDGARIGLHDNYPIVKTSQSGPMAPVLQYFTESSRTAKRLSNDSMIPLDCGEEICDFIDTSLAWDESPMKRIETDLEWQNKTWRLAPPLTIAAQDVQPPQGDRVRSYVVLTSNWRVLPADYEGNMRFAFGETAVSLAWVNENSICQTLNKYQWGFSSLLLLGFCILTILFTLALAFLQLEVYWYSRLYRAGSDASVYHDILGLAEELWLALAKAPKSWADMTAQELTSMAEHVWLELEADELPPSRSDERFARKDRDHQKLIASREKDAREEAALVRYRIIAQSKADLLPYPPPRRFDDAPSLQVFGHSRRALSSPQS